MEFSAKKKVLKAQPEGLLTPTPFNNVKGKEEAFGYTTSNWLSIQPAKKTHHGLAMFQGLKSTSVKCLVRRGKQKGLTSFVVLRTGVCKWEPRWPPPPRWLHPQTPRWSPGGCCSSEESRCHAEDASDQWVALKHRVYDERKWTATMRSWSRNMMRNYAEVTVL